MARDRTHIFVRTSPEPDPYKPHPRTMTNPGPPSPDNPEGHAALLKQALESAVTAGLERRSSSGITVAGATPGLYVVFEGQPGFGLKLESFDVKRSGIALTSVTQED